MVNLNFNIENKRLQIDLATFPEGCHTVELLLPDGNQLTHHFGEQILDDAAVMLENLSELIKEFIDYLEFQEDRKKNTITGYRRRLGQFTDWLRLNKKCHPAEPETWTRYYASLKRRKLSVYTRKGHYHILNRFGTWLLKKGYVYTAPLKDVRPPDLPKNREPKAIFRQHIQAMLAMADDHRDRTILLFFRDTGCRASEALNLTWGDIHLDERKVMTMGKGDTQRKLYFKPITRQALQTYRESVPHKKTDPVWWGHKGPLGYDGLYKIFKRLAEKANIEDENFNPHAWRHAFGRDTTIAGLPTAQLQDLMGHSTMEVTKIYAQFDSAELQRAHDHYSPVDDDLTDTPATDNHDPEDDTNE